MIVAMISIAVFAAGLLIGRLQMRSLADDKLSKERERYCEELDMLRAECSSHVDKLVDANIKIKQYEQVLGEIHRQSAVSLEGRAECDETKGQ